MNSAKQGQFLDKAICISLCTDVLWGMYESSSSISQHR